MFTYLLHENFCDWKLTIACFLKFLLMKKKNYSEKFSLRL